MKLEIILFTSLLLNYNTYSQSKDIANYKMACFKINTINRVGKHTGKFLKSDKFLNKNQIYVSFYLTNSDSITVFLNNDCIKEKNIEVPERSTGDFPSYSFVAFLLNKNNKLIIYFEKDKSFIEIPIDKKFKVYEIGFYDNCYYVGKQNYISIY